MNETSHLQSLLIDIAHEHHDLQLRLQELKHLVRKVDAGTDVKELVSKIAAALASLREQMKAHFAAEAAGGVMDEAVARLPRLADEATRIEREHPELLKSIDRVIELAHQVLSQKQEWPNLQTAVNQFASQMLAHEATENRLLQEGFNEDLGALA